MNTIPYFVIYSGEYKVFRNKLSEEEMLQVIDKISDISVLGVSDIEFTNPFQELYFEKLIAQYTKNLRSYLAKVENGKKGGRPKKVDEPSNEPKANSPPIFKSEKTKKKTAEETKLEKIETEEVLKKARALMEQIKTKSKVDRR